MIYLYALFFSILTKVLVHFFHISPSDVPALIPVILFSMLVLWFLGYLIVVVKQKKQLAKIIQREEKYKDIKIFSHEINYPQISGKPVLCSQSLVIATYLPKRVLSSIINFFGGRDEAHLFTLDLARREVILRLIENNPKLKQLINLRVQTSWITFSICEIHVYGTGIFEI